MTAVQKYLPDCRRRKDPDFAAVEFEGNDSTATMPSLANIVVPRTSLRVAHKKLKRDADGLVLRDT